jgi:selenocysteine lyase/cysteine desulfurase
MHPFTLLEAGVFHALETYSNVHRGSGQFSLVSTRLFERARTVVLGYLKLPADSYTVIFCNPLRSHDFREQLPEGSWKEISSASIGLALGVNALAVKNKSLRSLTRFQTGGGTTKLISKEWIIWDDAPGKYEAGTPAVINIITFIRALLIIQSEGQTVLSPASDNQLSVQGILYADLLPPKGKELLDSLKGSLIGRGMLVPTLKGDKTFMNFDNSASTQSLLPSWDAFRLTLQQPLEIQRQMIDEVKSVCSRFLGAPSDQYEITFTSNTTESINLAARSSGLSSPGSVIVNTLLEHSSNEIPWRMLPGQKLLRLSVSPEGFPDLKELEVLLKEYNSEQKFGNQRIKLVTVTAASNVLGICPDLETICSLAHQYGAEVMVDAAQMVAHRKVDMQALGIDYLAFSGHKVYAPFGCGVLISRKGRLHFREQEMTLIRSSGEANAAGITALGKSLLMLERVGMDLIHEEESALLKKMLLQLSEIKGVKVYGVQSADSPGFDSKLGVVVFSPAGMMPSKVAKELAFRAGIGVRHGCHCAHIIMKHILGISPFLEQFQRLIQHLFPKFRFLGLVRVSLGIGNTAEEIEILAKTMDEIISSKTDKKYRLSSDQKSEIKRLMGQFETERVEKVFNTKE